MSSSDDKINAMGTVTSARGNGHFLVQIESGQEVLCTLSGKMRNNNIRVVEEDFVEIEISVYDLTRGRIIFRKK